MTSGKYNMVARVRLIVDVPVTADQRSKTGKAANDAAKNLAANLKGDVVSVLVEEVRDA